MTAEERAREWLENNQGMNSTALIRDLLAELEQDREKFTTASHNARHYSDKCCELEKELEQAKQEIEVLKKSNEMYASWKGEIAWRLDNIKQETAREIGVIIAETIICTDNELVRKGADQFQLFIMNAVKRRYGI